MPPPPRRNARYHYARASAGDVRRRRHLRTTSPTRGTPDQANTGRRTSPTVAGPHATPPPHARAPDLRTGTFRFEGNARGGSPPLRDLMSRADPMDGQPLSIDLMDAARSPDP